MNKTLSPLTGLFWAASAALISGCPSFAQSSDLDLPALEALLATPQSPLLAPATYNALEASEGNDPGATRIRLIDVAYAGQTFDSLSFDLSPEDDEGRFVVSNLSLPARLSYPIEDAMVTIDWQELSWRGLFDLAAGAYQSLDLQIEGLTLRNEESGFNVQFATLIASQSFNAASRSSTVDLDIADIAFSIQDLSAQVQGGTEGVRLTWEATGYGPGENPFATLGAELAAGLTPLFAQTDASAKALAALSPEDRLVPDTLTLAGTIDPIRFVAQDIDVVTVTLDTMEIAADLTGQRTPGAAQGMYSYLLKGFEVSDPANEMLLSIGTLNGGYTIGDADFSATSPLYATTTLYDPNPGTYGPLADMLGAIGTVTTVFRLEDMAIEFLSEDASMALESLGVRFEGDLSEDQSRLSLDLNASTFTTNQVAGALLPTLLPGDAQVRLQLEGVDLKGFKALLAAAERSGSLIEEATVERDLQRALPALLTWWQGMVPTLGPTLSYTSEALNFNGEGRFDLDAASDAGLVGTLTLTLQDFEALQARIAEASTSDNLEDQQIAASLLVGIGMAGGFGELQDDGALVFELRVSEAGDLTINGLPLPF